MKIDNTTDADDLVNTVLLSGDKDARNAARAELARRDARLNRLTQALPYIASLRIEVKRYGVVGWGKVEGSVTIDHNGTPDGIADAIIAAYEQIIAN